MAPARPQRKLPSTRPVPVVTPFVSQVGTPLPPLSLGVPKKRRAVSSGTRERLVAAAHTDLRQLQPARNRKYQKLSQTMDMPNRSTVHHPQNSASKSISKTHGKATNLISFLQAPSDSLPNTMHRENRTRSLPSVLRNIDSRPPPPSLLAGLADAAATISLAAQNTSQASRLSASQSSAARAPVGSTTGFSSSNDAPVAASFTPPKFGTVVSTSAPAPQISHQSPVEEVPGLCSQRSLLSGAESRYPRPARGKRGSGRGRGRITSVRKSSGDHTLNARNSHLLNFHPLGTKAVHTSTPKTVSRHPVGISEKGVIPLHADISPNTDVTPGSTSNPRAGDVDRRHNLARDFSVQVGWAHATTARPSLTVTNVQTVDVPATVTAKSSSLGRNLSNSNISKSNVAEPQAVFRPSSNAYASQLTPLPNTSTSKPNVVTPCNPETTQNAFPSSRISQRSRESSDLSNSDLPARKRIYSRTPDESNAKFLNETPDNSNSDGSLKKSVHPRFSKDISSGDATEGSVHNALPEQKNFEGSTKYLSRQEKFRVEIKTVSTDTANGSKDCIRQERSTAPDMTSKRRNKNSKSRKQGSESELEHTEEDNDENIGANEDMIMGLGQRTDTNGYSSDSENEGNDKIGSSDDSGIINGSDANKTATQTMKTPKSGPESCDYQKTTASAPESLGSREQMDLGHSHSSESDDDQHEKFSRFGSESESKLAMIRRPTGSNWRKGPSMVQSLNAPDIKSDGSGSAALASQETSRDDVVTTGSTEVYEAGTGALLSLKDVAQSRNIFWAKVRGFPFWPAQHVSGFADLSVNMHFKKAEYGRRKDTDTCVMFFGSCEVAFVKRDVDVVSWEEGVAKRFHNNKRHGRIFKKAIRQARAACRKPTPIFPRDWWCSPPTLDWWDRLGYVMRARDESLASIPIPDDMGDDGEELDPEEVTDDLAQEADVAFARADAEGVFWVFRDGIPVAVQRLPEDAFLSDTTIEASVARARRRVRSGSVLCIEFGRGDVCVEEEENFVPLQAGASNVIRLVSHMTDGQALPVKISAGEAWGYVQQPRAWPSGYLSGRPWWNFREGAKILTVSTSHNDCDSNSGCRSSSSELGSLTAKPDVLLGTLMHYEHVDRNVFSDVLMITKNEDTFEGILCDENGKDEYGEPTRYACTDIRSKCDCGGKRGPAKSDKCLDEQCSNWEKRYFCTLDHCSNSRCSNKHFQSRKRLLTAPVVLESSRGVTVDTRKKWALRCDEDGDGGTFVGEFVGDVLSLTDFAKRLCDTIVGVEGPYAWRLNRGFVVDARYRGNFTRFLHGSCTPNCCVQVWTDSDTMQQHLGVFLKTSVEKGTILTVPHHFADIGMTGESLWCTCSPVSTARRTLNPIEIAWARQRVGRRIRVEWDSGWYNGMVARYNERSKKFDILYDDGDKESLSLGFPLGKEDRTKFIWLT